MRICLIILFLSSMMACDQQKEPLNEVEKSPWDSEIKVVEIHSTIDTTIQKAYFYATTSNNPQPLVINLHTWSNDYTQYDTLSDLSKSKNYNYIHPDFRGQNNSKNACCSEFVIADIDAAIDYVITNANVDTTQMYVIGTSGGGYATIATFMKSRHSIRKFSAWVPLVDLVAWYKETSIRKLKYAPEILACTHSVNNELNLEVAKSKSPIYWETPIDKLKSARLEIYTGVYDGMIGNGVIPITHGINFYNKVLKDLGETNQSKFVSDAEKLALLEFREPLGDFGSIGDRKVCLIKECGNIKLTIFTGGHEQLKLFAFKQL